MNYLNFFFKAFRWLCINEPLNFWKFYIGHFREHAGFRNILPNITSQVFVRSQLQASLRICEVNDWFDCFIDFGLIGELLAMFIVLGPDSPRYWLKTLNDGRRDAISCLVLELLEYCGYTPVPPMIKLQDYDDFRLTYRASDGGSNDVILYCIGRLKIDAWPRICLLR